MTPFLILSMARSGTQMLSTLLAQHPDVTCHGEVLNPFTDIDDTAISHLLWRRPEHAGQKAVGVTLMPGHLTYRPFTLYNLLRTPNIHVIVLERANQLERLRSQTQAEQIYRWDVLTPADDLPAVTLNPDDTLISLQQASLWHQQLAGIPNWMMWLYYEDLINDPDRIMQAVWSFLDVPQNPVAVTTYQQEHRSLTETVSNCDDITKTLAGTRYEWMLGEQ